MGEVQIGALVDLTGDLADLGEASEAAINLAVGEVNELLGEAGARWTLKVLFRDTQTNPDVALTQLEDLFNREGVEFVIGPMTSSEVLGIKDYANTNEILVVSQASTMPHLAIPDDFIFRFCPQDSTGQGPAIARLMYDDGKRYVIPVWRNDVWGNGLVNAVKTRFEGLGGFFLDGITYSPGDTDFSDEALALNGTVTSAVGTYGADEVGVLYLGFDEASNFLTEARPYKILWNVKWYGSDGTALDETLIGNAPVAMMCAATGFTNTMFGPTRSDKYYRVHDELVAVLGREPDCYAYVAYDIVWALAYSLSLVNRYNSLTVKGILPTVTESLFGASGWIVLDENGDRAFGDYDLWQIVAVEPKGYEWEHVGTWFYSTDSITWLYLRQYFHLVFNSGYAFKATSEDWITLGHGWFATTEQYVEDFRGNVTLAVKIDGAPITGEWSDIYLVTEGAWAGYYVTEWRPTSPGPGPLPAGEHHVTAVLDLAEAVYDGINWYGPGTANPTPWNYALTIQVT